MRARRHIPALAIAGLAASCSLGGGDEPEPRPAREAARDAAAAVGGANTVHLTSTATVRLDGAPDLGGLEAFIRGPITVTLDGRAGRRDGRWARLVADVSVETSGIAIDGELRSLDGRTFDQR
jgi:hypothetical protein